MTGTRPGAEFFGRPSQQQPQQQSNMPTFGPPSRETPRTAAQPTQPVQPTQPPPGGAVYGSTVPPGGTHVPPAQPPSQGVMARARADDPRALETLFEQFVPQGEQIVETRYLGVIGLWGIGTHSFAAVTTHRVASLRVGIFGEVLYQDGALEYVNSSAIYQPSRLELYWPAVLWVLVFVGAAIAAQGSLTLLTLFALLIALLFVPVIVRLQYRFKKSGLVISIREGMSLYVFIDRTRIALANRFYRLCMELREERIREVGHP
jgi:hypothetical protein